MRFTAKRGVRWHRQAGSAADFCGRACCLLLGLPGAGRAHAEDAAATHQDIVITALTGQALEGLGIANAGDLVRAGASIQMPPSLLQAADTALYKARSNGLNRVETTLLLSGAGSPSAAA
ncbi:PleD family two-component system response regulator [Novosphingobium terrae]|uniref:hypothetical protein n=1 Tax=Novosphingobium terrae TaxID=2726189 RepID=UPI0019825577|nr:hypothetical protein [Novosphingobium terrae]